jgi:hypothetical protein
MTCRSCPLSCRWLFACLVAGVLAAPASSYAEWYGDFEVSVSPSTPTSLETFDLLVTQVFGDPSQELAEQSISIDGDRIRAFVLMRDLFGVFPQVVTTDGAFFDDIGPLAAGTYHVDAEMWMRRPREIIGEETVLINRGSLTFEVVPAATPVAGDFNEDGVVDAADFVVWRKNFNSMSDVGGGAEDSAFTISGYEDWRANFGRAAAGTGASLVANSAAVPEPTAATTFILLLPLICLRAARRRRAIRAPLD